MGENKTQLKFRSGDLEFLFCNACGYVNCPANNLDYLKMSKLPVNLKPKVKNSFIARVGDGVTPGREFLMAAGAVDIIGKRNLKVLIFGAGGSLDHVLIRKLKAVSECKITDVKNFQESEYFIRNDSKEFFDIIIVYETIEHFTQPRKDFYNLFSFFNKEALLVISTDLRCTLDISKDIYPFFFGHCSYYSAESLIYLANLNKLYIDFKKPKGSACFPPKNKRYIYMTNSKETHNKLIAYFSRVKQP
jgi:hypothetical protein